MKHTTALMLLLVGCAHAPTHQVFIGRISPTRVQGQMQKEPLTPSPTSGEIDNPYEKMEEEEKNPYEEMEREQRTHTCAAGDPLCDTLEK